MRKSVLLKFHSHLSPLWTIFEVAFLRNLAIAVLTAILPVYFRQLVDSDAAVGIILLVGYFSAFISNIYSAYIIEHLKKRKTMILALIAFTLLLASFAIINHTPVAVAVFASYQFILALFVMDVSLYIKHYSNFRTLASNTGKLGSFGNLGWLFGPLLGSLIADKFGFEYVFLFSSFISLIALSIFFFMRLSNETVRFEHQQSFRNNIKSFFKEKNLRRTYINNAGLGFIFSIWDFLPLLMLKIGATLPIIGMTKTLMGVSQSVFEYPIGQLADKETGERKIFIVGYALAAVFTILLGFTTNLHFFITFFFIAAIGTSFLEMTRDSYFFRQMPEKEIELVSVYRTSDSLPFFVGQSFAVFVLSFLSVQWWFIIGGIIGLLFILNAYKLQDLRSKVWQQSLNQEISRE